MPSPSRIVRPLIALALAATAATPHGARAQAASASGEVLTNASVVEMINGKLQKSLILTKIQGTRSAYDVTADGLITLTQSKVPQDVMKAMMVAAASGSRPAQGAPETLSNEIIVRMIVAKVPKPLVLDKIRLTRGTYDVTTTGLVNLNQNKVPQDVIKAMMTAAGS